jgi:hypothetical protein
MAVEGDAPGLALNCSPCKADNNLVPGERGICYQALVVLFRRAAEDDPVVRTDDIHAIRNIQAKVECLVIREGQNFL